MPTGKIVLLALLLSGCSARWFAAKTEATYEADGRRITYESTKEQTGLTVTYEVDPAGKVSKVLIHVDKAATPEASIDAALKANLAWAEIMKSLIPLIEKAAAAGS